ncbi:hypothetical protein DFH27DRAFT_312359 [Peziza echinospora]|nr:hypothetical protein DFH27DRAFT_312359 [Peziza echinospora]
MEKMEYAVSLALPTPHTTSSIDWSTSQPSFLASGHSSEDYWQDCTDTATSTTTNDYYYYNHVSCLTDDIYITLHYLPMPILVLVGTFFFTSAISLSHHFPILFISTSFGVYPAIYSTFSSFFFFFLFAVLAIACACHCFFVCLFVLYTCALFSCPRTHYL